MTPERAALEAAHEALDLMIVAHDSLWMMHCHRRGIDGATQAILEMQVAIKKARDLRDALGDG